MWGYKIIPEEEVKRIYPEGSSHSAIRAHKAIADGYKVASIENENFNGSLTVAYTICKMTIEANCFNKMIRIVDLSQLPSKKVIVAFDDKCNT